MDGKKILMVVLDEKSVISSLDRSGYREMGVSVSTVSDIHELEDVLKSKAIDVVVINYDYKELNFSQAVRLVRDINKKAILVATTVVMNERHEAALSKFKLDLIIEQPIPRTYFIEQIKGLLSQKVRSDYRVQKDLGAVELTYNGKALVLEIADLSQTGMLIKSDVDFDLGKEIKLTFALPGESSKLKCTVTTVRNVKGTKTHPERINGVGVRFESFENSGEKVLEEFLARMNFSDVELKYYL